MKQENRKSFIQNWGMPITGMLFFALATLYVASGCAQKEVINRDSKGTSVVCFGDSLTYGYGVERGSDYPRILSQKINMPVINAGINSNTSELAKVRMQSDVLSYDPYIVVIEFGANDFMTHVPIDTTIANVRQLIRKSQEGGAMAFLVDVSAGLLMKEYQPAYARLASQTGAVFIPDVFAGIITNPRLKSDFVHPNAAGYDLIAERIHKALLPYLVKKDLLKKIVRK
ncbi:MAG TPA: GDSL-type esterase/lipase family protein [Candidatus Omnitrophota bacterium]|nr:GDSL-type esterase/lipase family protein [Candidatus Omnitrophota bacterium]HPT07058.1 GDSL-type esterase/lipase family protein [Candidatus Omnitrophota bacterium]